MSVDAPIRGDDRSYASVLEGRSPELKRAWEKIEAAKAAGHFVLADFHESAWQIVMAYDELVRESARTMQNGRLCAIIGNLVPESPFDNEDNYPKEELFVGEVPPPVAGVQGSTLHYAVYRLARQTLAQILDAAKEVDASFPEVRDKHTSFAELRRLPDELFGWNAIYRLIGTNHGWNDTRFATRVCRKLKLAPIQRDRVLLGLDVEQLRAEGRRETTLHRKTKQPVARLKIESRTVYVDGQLVPLDMTPERTDDALAFLGELLKEPGNWKSASDIGKATNKEGVRFDRVFKTLPSAINSLLESNRRKGYRFSALWRK